MVNNAALSRLSVEHQVDVTVNYRITIFNL